MLVATNYFTKWTEAVALKNMTHKEVIEFITEHIIHRFGIPQTLTTDQETSFMSKEVREFAELYRIKLLNSSPYYAQANGQAESSNRTLMNLIKKKISDNPKLCGLTEYLNTVLLKYLLLSLSMGRKQCCLWK
jgi:transposase InsO family protein